MSIYISVLYQCTSVYMFNTYQCMSAYMFSVCQHIMCNILIEMKLCYGLVMVNFYNNNNCRQQCFSMLNPLLIASNIWCTNVSCRCSDGDVCHVNAQMMDDCSVKQRAASIHFKQWRFTWDFLSQLQPATDWLVCLAEAVHTKTVYLGSCAMCLLYCYIPTTTHHVIDIVTSNWIKICHRKLSCLWSYYYTVQDYCWS